MNLLVLLCQLQLYFFYVKAIDLKLKPNQEVMYSIQNRLDFILSFANIPKLPMNQNFSSILYLKNTKSNPGPIKLYSGRESHFYDKQLDVSDDRTKIYVQIHNYDDESVYYEENILSLFYVNKTIGRKKNQCLSKCEICVNEWIPKPNPHIRLTFNGTIPSDITSYVSVREKVNITCTGYNMPSNTKTVMYINNNKHKEVPGHVIKETINVKEENTTNTIYCMAYYNDSKPVPSKTYKLLLKAASKRNNLHVLTKPELKKVTYYQIGERFVYNCTSSDNAAKTNFYWTRIKGDQREDTLTSSMSFVVIDIPLNETYNHNIMKCKASYFNEEKNNFTDVFIKTKLILNTDPKNSTPWWWYIIIILVIITIAASAIVVYCYRKRKLQNYDYVVDVQNELYGQERAAGVEYAQLYDHRNRAPPLPPPNTNRVPYANVVGYLKENN